MIIFVFLTGLVFGSFISAITWRIPRGIKIMDLQARSICPKCKHEINWYDNIPLLSFLILGGHCRNCKKKISIRYPLIELSTAIGFVATVYFATNVQGVSLHVVYSILIYLVLFVILFSIFVIDFEHQIIPDELVYCGIVVVIISNLQSPISSLLAGLICATLLLLVHLFTRGKGMGLGDVKFAVLGGMIVGLKLSLIWLFLAFLTGATLGIILILGKKAGLKSKIAFGPFLIIAIPLALIFGDKILLLLNI
jgi:prepilin signal peptidase PulO-like enzyme (type II secretory pathway)